MQGERGEVLRHCAVVGSPAAHSLSPALHRAGYRAVGLDWCYDAIEVAPGGLAEFVGGLDESWRGLSVTAPHKPDALALGRPDALAVQAGGANTLVFGDEPQAYNTDITGLRWALAEAGMARCARATVLGNGATARSVVVALAGMGLSQLQVVVRAPGRGADVLRLADSLGVAAAEATPDEAFDSVDLLASTVPTTASGEIAGRAVEAAEVVFDAVYDPWPTPLATAADAAGRAVVSGLDLLIGQALDQFELFTGHRLDPAVFRSAGQEELARRAAS